MPFFLADAYVAVEAHIIFNPSSMEVTAIIPRDPKNTFFLVVHALSESFLNAVTPPEATIRFTIPPISAITSTVNALSVRDIVFTRETAYPAAGSHLYMSITSKNPATISDSIVLLVISTYPSISMRGNKNKGHELSFGTNIPARI